ncbi:unnamed protein product [Didymodactylos carnosus]|uniref:Uncharacterized protein n=1 Tax=Didymodactylos carnosus TaxID=1234261 RepID=A0A815ZF78_9BILA|nr:unnamed protein product [Didymodactylos carnosus]CAF4451588.1 unnamed protein product [Didymodactylos carnosus]
MCSMYFFYIYNLGFRPPHRNQVQYALKRLHYEKKSALKDQLQQSKYIGVTTDFWSDRRTKSCLVLTGHYVTNRFQFVSSVLSFTTFQQRHNAIYISQEIEHQLKKLDIYNKITTITADGASSMRNAIDALSDGIGRIWCLAHKLHLTVTNGLCLWLKHKKQNDDDIQNTSDGVKAMSVDDLNEVSANIIATETSATPMNSATEQSKQKDDGMNIDSEESALSDDDDITEIDDSVEGEDNWDDEVLCEETNGHTTTITSEDWSDC